MFHFRMILLLLLASSSQVYGGPEGLSWWKWCGTLLSRLGVSQSRDPDSVPTRSERLALEVDRCIQYLPAPSQRRWKTALEKALPRVQSLTGEEPMLWANVEDLTPVDIRAFERRWLERQTLSARAGPILGKEKEQKVFQPNSQKNNVWQVTEPGTNTIARTLAGTQVSQLRREMAAAELIELFGSNSSPRVTLGLLQRPGQGGAEPVLFSQFVEGAKATEDAIRATSGPFPLDQLLNQVPDSNRYMMEALQRLMGNGDIRRSNLAIHGNDVRVYDHGDAFPSALGEVRELPGSRLPARYPKSFVARLQSVKPDEIRQALKPHLLSHEIDQVLLIREVMLVDIQANPNLVF